MINSLYTLIIWSGMYYATPDWMNKQIPEWMWSRYEIIIYPYGTPLTMDYDPKTTGLIGFSAGGLDVLKNYKKDYAFIGLIDPSTQKKFVSLEYSPNTYMLYNQKNWGTSNTSMTSVANKINSYGGMAISVSMKHADIPRYFFNTYFKNDKGR
jgi:hypothetical protein